MRLLLKLDSDSATVKYTKKNCSSDNAVQWHTERLEHLGVSRVAATTDRRVGATAVQEQEQSAEATLSAVGCQLKTGT